MRILFVSLLFVVLLSCEGQDTEDITAQTFTTEMLSDPIVVDAITAKYDYEQLSFTARVEEGSRTLNAEEVAIIYNDPSQATDIYRKAGYMDSELLGANFVKFHNLKPHLLSRYKKYFDHLSNDELEQGMADLVTSLGLQEPIDLFMKKSN